MATKAQLQEQLALVGERLRLEAAERGWCPDYDAFVDDVNAEAGAEVLSKCASTDGIMTYWVVGRVTLKFSDRIEVDSNRSGGPTQREVRDAVAGYMDQRLVDRNRAIDFVQSVSLDEFNDPQIGGQR